MDSRQAVQAFEEALLKMDRLLVKKIIMQASDDSRGSVIEQLIAPALESIGQQWEEGSLALSQLYMSGRICEEMIPLLIQDSAVEKKEHPKMAIAVLEDFHGLGKRIVLSTLLSVGYQLEDFGLGVQVLDLFEKVKAQQVKILLISVLMLPSALAIKTLIELFRENQLDVKVIVGGAPFHFDPNLYLEVGADGTAHSSSELLKLIDQVVQETT